MLSAAYFGQDFRIASTQDYLLTMYYQGESGDDSLDFRSPAYGWLTIIILGWIYEDCEAWSWIIRTSSIPFPGLQVYATWNQSLTYTCQKHWAYRRVDSISNQQLGK